MFNLSHRNSWWTHSKCWDSCQVKPDEQKRKHNDIILQYTGRNVAFDLTSDSHEMCDQVGLQQECMIQVIKSASNKENQTFTTWDNLQEHPMTVSF